MQLSYYIVDSLIWLGIRDLINEFRKKKLKLRPVTYLSGSYNSPPDVPYGYIWSPHLVPKPKGLSLVNCLYCSIATFELIWYCARMVDLFVTSDSRDTYKYGNCIISIVTPF